MKWIKQNLELKRFLANKANAVRIQIITAIITFVLLRLVAQARGIAVPLKRLRAVAKGNLFNPRAIDTLLEPPPLHPPPNPHLQLAIPFPGQ